MPLMCKEAPDTAEQPRLTVRALFAETAPMFRDCIRMYARMQTDVQATVVADGSALLRALRGGAAPQVLVLDVLMPGLEETRRALAALPLQPAPQLLLIAPLPEHPAARRALHGMGAENVLTRPFTMAELFERVYALGADGTAVWEYRVRSRCAGLLHDMRADPALSGTHYIKRMVQYALLAERRPALGELYELAAAEQQVDLRAVTAAVDRASRAMWRQGTRQYRALCVRCGLPPNARLSNGRLVMALIETIEQTGLW